MAWSIQKSLALAVLGVAAVLAGCEDPPKESSQNGYRGTAMVQHYNPEDFTRLIRQNQVPDPATPAPEGGQKASEVYQNVKVLGHLNQAQFTRLMNAMTQWVAPDQGCAYCHNLAEGFAYEGVYTKKVARYMLRMTMDINENWEGHVQSTQNKTGVTCYTCHRGNNVPQNVWYKKKPNPNATTMVGGTGYQDKPNMDTVYTSLPGNPFETYLLGEDNLTQLIRVEGNKALPNPNSTDSIQATESTYGLMMHQSDALGVNCTYCHNSRQFANWKQSPPQRRTAWHGQRMTRAINNDYIVQTTDLLPEKRLGPMGDASKVNCKTCHIGVYKPLFGANMVKDYPALDPNMTREEAAQLREKLGPDHGATYEIPKPADDQPTLPTSDSVF